MIMGKKHSKERREREGRPTKLTLDVIAKLEDAFSNAFTDEMACLYVGISLATLYRYCEDNLEFRDRKEVLKKRPDLVAQKTLVDDVKQVNGARWWAEHRMPEFMPKSKIEHAGKIETQDTTTSEAVRKVTDEYEDKLRKAIAEGRTASLKP